MQDCRHQLSQRSKRLIYLLAAIYLVWLLTVLFIFGYTPTNDGNGYLEYAQWCLSEGSPYPTISIYQQTPFIWNIGIINLTELSLWIFGSILPILLLFCVLKAAIAFLTALIAGKLFGERIAIAAIILFILYPNNWGQSTMLSSEIPSTFLCLMAVFLVVNHTFKNPWTYAFIGVLLGLANWCRPTAAIFIVSIIIYLLISNNKSYRKAIQPIGTLLAGFLLFIVVVGTSCYLRTGHFVYQARNYWFSMVDECYDGAAVAPHWGQPIWPEGTPRYIEGHEQMNCFDFDRIWRQRSIDYLKDHKLNYLKKIPGRLYYMYQSDYDYCTFLIAEKSDAANNYITLPIRHILTEISTLSRTQWLALVCLIFYGALLILAFIGTVRLFRQCRFMQLFLPLFILVAGSLALVLVMHGETRFKDPFMPYLFMLAAAGTPKLRLLKTQT